MKPGKGMVLCMIGLVVGCGTADVNKADVAPKSSLEGNRFVISIEPTGAVPVGMARDSIEGGQEVTLVGIIGGSSQPFVDGLAAFTVVDPKVPYCSAEENCPTPWDYCCTQDQVKDNIATVKVVDESGKPVAQDARRLLGVKELSTVVVQGTAARDERGNLTVAATGVFIRPTE